MSFNPFSWPLLDAVKFGVKSYQKYIERSRKLDPIKDALASSRKLDPSQCRRLSRDFENNTSLREAILQANNKSEIVEVVTYYSSDWLPYATVADEIATIFLTNSLDLHPDFVQKETLRIVASNQGQLQENNQLLEVLKQHVDALVIHQKYIEYANSAVTRVRTDPLSASADFVTEALKGSGVERFTVNVESGQAEVKYKDPEMTISARGPTAKKLQQMVEDNQEGRLFHYIFDESEDFTILIKEYGPQPKLDDTKPSRIEFYTAPLVLDRQMRFSVGETNFITDVKVTRDEIHGTTLFEPQVIDPNVNLRIMHDQRTQRANLNVDMKLAEERPNQSSLPLLRFLAALRPGTKLKVFDIEIDKEIWHLELSRMSAGKELLEIAQYANFVKDFLEADAWLKIRDVVTDGLEWPITTTNDQNTAGLIQRMARVLKDEDNIGFMQASMMMEDINDAVKDIRITGGVIKGQMMRVRAPVIINQKHICDQEIVFIEPKVKLTKNGKVIKCKRLGDVFPSLSAPIKFQVSHSKASTSFRAIATQE